MTLTLFVITGNTNGLENDTHLTLSWNTITQAP